MQADIHVGPAGWSYRDWNHIVYPANRPAGFHEAGYLSQFFSTLEVNTSFYRPLRPELSRVWAAKMAGRPGFRFTVKLFRGFTHEGTQQRRTIKEFCEGLEPLIDAGMLGCVLMQFPWAFRHDAQNLRRVLALGRTFAAYPLVAEFRHDSWNDSLALGALAGQGIGFCNIDQPRLNQCLPPTCHVTSETGYVRLHGRNYENWFSTEEPAAGGRTPVQARYDYLYSMEQLEKWAPRIRRIAEQAKTVYVVTNNHFQGKAVANALQILSLVTGEPVEAPPTLLDHYPELNRIARNLPPQRSLFFRARSETKTFGPAPARRVAAYAGA